MQGQPTATAKPLPSCPIESRQIMDMLPHRYPFLLVDRVLYFEVSKRLTAIKNVTINEPFFIGHFPNQPVMPGVLILEALAQASGLLVQLSASSGRDDALYYLVKIDKARFTQVVKPGDQLVLEVTQLRMRMRMGHFACRALVDGVEVASAEMLCAERGPQ
jgi:3-hydroxyacyl-[acyl-carrier-protein] dehydratase